MSHTRTRDMKQVAWQKFGDWCLTGQYADRPIFLSVVKGKLRTLDRKSGLLVPFDPENEYAKRIVLALRAAEGIPDEMLEFIGSPEATAVAAKPSTESSMLIAAAPDMLAALQAIVGAVEAQAGEWDAYKLAEAAIAKATGKEPS